MRYFKTLERAAQGLSEMRPRSLSRFEQPEAEWGEAELAVDAAPPDLPPRISQPPPVRPMPPLDPPIPAPPVAPMVAAPQAQPLPSPALPEPPSVWPAPTPQPIPPALPPSAAPSPGTTSKTAPASAMMTVVPGLAAPQAVALTERIIAEAGPQPGHQIDARIQPAASPPSDPVPPPPLQQVNLVPAALPSPAPEQASAPEAPIAPPLIIEIGQIDIRIEAPPRAVPAPEARRGSAPVLSLDAYLGGRT